MWWPSDTGLVTDDATERTRVQTYVPAYQKDIWADHADDLGMTQSEFVRTMVQAGRRGFLGGSSGERVAPEEPPGEASSGSDPEGERVETVVVEALADGPLDWDALVERLTADVEDRLDDVLASLQEENRLRYSGREGGYVLTDE
jgi:hypothetical protein